MKLWEKNFEVNKEIERFTVGRDRELDLYLAKYDVLGSMAHITMLESIGLLESDELHQLLAELRRIYSREGIDCRFIVTDPENATGLASIMVEPSGQNRIIVFPGANSAICGEDVESAMLCRPDALFMQLEISPDAIIYAANYAAAHDIPIFIDAGPALPGFPFDKLPRLEVFSPNETETEAYTGISPSNPDACLRAATALSRMVDAHYYVIKLGGRVAYIYDG